MTCSPVMLRIRVVFRPMCSTVPFTRWEAIESPISNGLSMAIEATRRGRRGRSPAWPQRDGETPPTPRLATKAVMPRRSRRERREQHDRKFDKHGRAHRRRQQRRRGADLVMSWSHGVDVAAQHQGVISFAPELATCSAAARIQMLDALGQGGGSSSDGEPTDTAAQRQTQRFVAGKKTLATRSSRWSACGVRSAFARSATKRTPKLRQKVGDEGDERGDRRAAEGSAVACRRSTSGGSGCGPPWSASCFVPLRGNGETYLRPPRGSSEE